MSAPHDIAERNKTTNLSANLIMQAPAGSGKTSELTKRFLACLSVSENPEEVLGITFTNKATAEMQERILSALRRATNPTPPESDYERQMWELGRKVLERDRDSGWHLLVNASRLRIMTFDKLSAYLATQLPVLSGVGGGLQIEENAEILYREAIINLFEEFEQEDLEQPVREALEHLLRFAGNRLDRLIPLLVDMLQKRDQWMEVLRETGSMEMENALRALVDTTLAQVDSVLDSSLKQEIAQILKAGAVNKPLAWAAGLDSWPAPSAAALPLWREIAGVLLTGTGTLIKRVTVTIGFPAKEANTERMKALLEDMHESNPSALEAALGRIARLPDPTYPPEMEVFREALSVAMIRLVAHLKLVFAGRGKVDFIEVAQRALEALGDDENVTDVLQRLDHTIRHILVDEVQDTSIGQIRLLQRLTTGWQPGEGRSLFMVGDPQQSIYMFRQAEVRLFLEMWNNGELADQVPLEQAQLTNNFRSNRPVVEWFNGAFAKVFPPAADPYTSAVTFSPSSSLCESDEGSVSVHPFIGADSQAEADMVVSLVQQAITRDPDGSIAILVRGRSHVVDIVRELKEAGIGYSAQDIDPIAASAPVNDLFNLIQALRQPSDRTAWFHVLRAPFVGIGWEDAPTISRIIGYDTTPSGLRRLVHEHASEVSTDTLQRISRLIETVERVWSTPVLAEHLPRAVEAVWRSLGGEQCVTQTQRKDIQSLLDTLEAHCEAGQIKNLRAFEIAAQKLFATPENGQVQIMTIHKSKGLEFDTVILPGLGKMPRRDDPPLFHLQGFPAGFVVAPAPRREARKEDTAGKRLYDAMGSIKRLALENEAIRLLYVAVTRARKHLHLLGHASAGKSAPYPASGSLLSLLWPAVGSDYLAVAGNGQVENTTPPSSPADSGEHYHVPTVRRLPLDQALEAPAPFFLPAYNRALLPSELVTGGGHQEGLAEHASAIGQVYHLIMEAIATTGVEHWDSQRLADMHNGVVARLQGLGVSSSEVSGAAGRVLALANSTLESEQGRWILGSHPWAASEYAVGGFMEGRWVSAVIDRAFETDDGVLWVVDYKSSGQEIGEGQKSLFMAKEARSYQPQLAMYERLLRECRPGVEIRTALFFPAFGELLEEDASEAAA